MKIYIHPTALHSEDRDLLPPVALTSLKRLQELGYDLFADLSSFNDSALDLLNNEMIKIVDGNQEQADAVIIRASDGKSTNENSLILQNNEGVVCQGRNWAELCERIMFPARKAELNRDTRETQITASILLDGRGESSIQTGLSFFDHMLDQIARHGLIDLTLNVQGDLEVDEHHTIEDTAIVLGTVIREAITDNKAGIQRYGFALPMDEAQAMVAIDLSDRPFLRWDVDLKREYVGDFPTEMLEHFFYTLAMNVRATIHVSADGKNEHHVIESIFKGFAKALRFAISRNERMKGILPSTKGMI